ncbi:efflux RND transporter periplasmic adaptor subunit [Xanthobacter tagetidis]|uniref:Efflux RND transporter periplasmic adaptor subunit n=1 Tax=Xanthobacter tagetidis TaxID=60216 RepID=A0A3L7AJ04_9HYPH|nr:efflux RND transporter periplasmic adaptor subunit [Xanthobacter tagetidis]MBB6306912.1 RND family efflux transporter MFP subunit [Xanthobacter tagetidis]RLP80024.1 efflux RND transporter periplasmic adaptor subunit [Xanthobacter tagetidis]
MRDPVDLDLPHPDMPHPDMALAGPADLACAGLRIAAGTAALIGLVFLAGCGESAPAQTEGPRARPVQVVTVALAPREAEKRFVGVVRARREIDLAFRVAGKVTQRLVGIGDRVEPGTVVARIDPDDLKLELQSAEAEFAAAKANLSQNAAEDERARSLTAKGFASAAELDRKALAKEEAVGRLERARRSLELAQNRLSYADLVADQAGVVIATAAEPGQVVSTGQTIVRVARLDEKEALVALPEIDLADARTAPASMELWAAPGKAYAVKLRELSPQADATSRTYPARFTIADPDAAVALGMTASVTLHPKDQAKVARLPLSAVIDKGHGPLVYVVEPGTATLAARPVKIAAYTDAQAIIAAGLNEGDQVVTLGVQTLEAGLAVRTVPAKAQAQVAAAAPAVGTRP